MSRVGQQPIPVPPGVEVDIDGSRVTVNGPKGSLTQAFAGDLSILLANGSLSVERPSDESNLKALHGLTRSLLSNMVTGVSQGYQKTLELVGVGYRVQQSGAGITMSVMLSHTPEVQPGPGVSLEVEGNNLVHVRGVDKQAVGQTAAEIRSIRPPNAYTGKGVRYRGEQVKTKPGKSARRAE